MHFECHQFSISHWVYQYLDYHKQISCPNLIFITHPAPLQESSSPMLLAYTFLRVLDIIKRFYFNLPSVFGHSQKLWLQFLRNWVSHFSVLETAGHSRGSWVGCSRQLGTVRRAGLSVSQDIAGRSRECLDNLRSPGAHF
jgi:hypothetical protein